MNQFGITSLSNRADWTGFINITEAGTGEEIDCTAAGYTDLLVELQDPDTGRSVLNGSIGNGVSEVDASRGMFSFSFAATETVGLRPKNYLFGGIIKTATQTLQLFRVRILAYDGIVG